MGRLDAAVRFRHAAVREVLGASPVLLRKHLERTTLRAADSYEPELRLLREALGQVDDFVDVGANLGIYSTASVLAGAKTWSFEPNLALALRLQRALPEASVVASAVSDSGGLATLTIPRQHGTLLHSRASIVSSVHAGTEASVVAAPLVRLDDCLASPGFVIKIDVEGNESAVLAGAEASIRAGAMMAIVESEERHNPGAPEETIEWFRERGFDGWMIRDGCVLEEADRYQSIEHQSADDQHRLLHGGSPSNNYVNNFLFVRSEGPLDMQSLASGAGFTFVT